MKFGRKGTKEDVEGWERKKWLSQFDQSTSHACIERESLNRNF